jgi:hypothetical protein
MAENQPIRNLILRGVAVAMGVAAVMLSVLGSAESSTLITLLGIGLFAIAIDAIDGGGTK